MSLVDKDVDLAALSRGTESGPDSVEAPRRSWLRIVVPLAILLAFGWVLRDTLKDLLQSRVSVSVLRPTRLDGPAAKAQRGESTPDAPRTLAIQAAGWVEPDPFPSHAPALGGGVVQKMLVQESDRVEVGQLLAELVSDDARLAHAEASATVESRRAALAVLKVKAGIAVERYDAALEVTEAAASAAAVREGREAEAKHREASVEEGVALVSLAESEVVVQRELDAAGASGTRQVEIAEAAHDVAAAKLATLRADLALAQASALEAKAADERAQADLRLRFSDRLARDETAAAVAHAEALLSEAEARLATAALALERTRVVSPSKGVILERLAAEGDVLSPGQAIASLYDPTRLRVRVDVPQGDLERIRVGQSAEVLADARPGRPYKGEVIRIVERADIQKVTLEAQVRVLDVDDLLRPDMLTQVRFFDSGGGDGATAAASASPGSTVTQTARMRLAIPRRLAAGGAVWTVDPVTRMAVRTEVSLGESVPGDSALVEVLSGLNLTSQVVDVGVAALQARYEGGESSVPVSLRVPRTEESGDRP